jgi:hypothetical protein
MRDAYRRRPEDFKRRILSICGSKIELYDKEYDWLSLIRKEELGKKYYNHFKVKYVGDVSTVGRKPSPETIAKRSASLKATYNTSEKKAEQSARSKAYWEKEGTKEYHRKVMTEIWATDEHREKVIPKLIAAQNNAEQKEIISRTTKERWLDQEYRQNHTNKRTGVKLRTRTEEENEANRQRQLKAWTSEEHIQKMSNAHRTEFAQTSSRKNIKATHTEESRKKSSETKRIKRLDPVYEKEYLAMMKEKAKLAALKRWHPEKYAALKEQNERS